MWFGVVQMVLKIITVIILMALMFIRCSLCGTLNVYVFMDYLPWLWKTYEVGASICPFYGWGNSGFTSLRNLPKVTQLGNSRVRTQVSGSPVYPEMPAHHLLSPPPGTMESTWAWETDKDFVQVCHLTFYKLLHFSEPPFFNWSKMEKLIAALRLT